jgi:recombination protein RecR
MCAICADSRRDGRVLCVVEEPVDVTAIEKTGAYRGMYYVLHGALSPMDNVGPEDIKTQALIELVKKEGIEEIILATNLDAEGDATAHHLAKQLKSLKVKTTRIARGVPVGGDLQYVDEVTLGESIAGRREIAQKPEKN